MDSPFLSSNGHVTNRQLYEALMSIQSAIADIRVQVATLPCHEHARAMDERDNRIREMAQGYKAADQELKQEIQRKQVAWTTGGAMATLAAIAAWFGIR